MEDMFNNLMEILAPSPAPKEILPISVVEVGSEVPLKAVNGRVFQCFVLMPMKAPGTGMIKCKYILAVTDAQIVEMYPHSVKGGVAVAAEAHDLQALAKLKFKKGEQGVLLLEYKNGKISKILMDDPADCVGYIKLKMSELGINGNIKNKHDKVVENAQSFFVQAKQLETDFAARQHLQLIHEMMDLLRRATEKFSEVNDDSYMEVMQFIKQFLQRPDVDRVLQMTVVSPDKNICEKGKELEKNVPLTMPTALSPVEEPPVASPRVAPRASDPSPHDSDTPPSAAPATTIFSVPAPSPSPIVLPDVDEQLSSLQNAITYHFDEDDHHHHHTSSVARSKDISDSINTDHCELTAMLEKMTSDFDTLLESMKHDTVEQDKDETLNENNTSVSEFMEIDFEESLNAAVKMLQG